MNLSKELEHHKAKYETKHKKLAFEKGQPTIEFTESIIRVMNFHNSNFIKADLLRSTSLIDREAELTNIKIELLK